MALFVLAVNKGLCATFRTVLKIVALINENPVRPKLLKGNDVILAALVVELGQPCLQRFPGTLHLLDRVAFRLLRLGLLDSFQDFLDLAFQNGLLALHAHGDFFKLTVANDFVAMPSVSEDGRIDASVERPYSEVCKGFTYFAENDVLFAKITPCMENGPNQ